MSVTEPIPTTLQGIFDRVSVHLLTQKRISEGSVWCLYRGPDGLMCAVGCLIHDDIYSPSMEHKPVDEIELPAELRAHMTVLVSLQEIHDLSRPESWRDCLKSFAEHADLSTAAMDAVP